MQSHVYVQWAISASVLMQAGNGLSPRAADAALAGAQLVDLPNIGALVLPLAAHTFLVGLLVIEHLVLVPQLPAGTDQAYKQLADEAKPVRDAGLCCSPHNDVGMFLLFILLMLVNSLSIR